MPNTETFMRGDYVRDYVACALWSSTDTDPETGDVFNLDEDCDYSDCHLATLQAMRDDLAGFLFAARRLIRAVDMSPEQAAHDFWLTRCGHGAGFWDRGYPRPIGDALTRLAKNAGNADLYVGDDGMIYQMGREPVRVAMLPEHETQGGAA